MCSYYTNQSLCSCSITIDAMAIKKHLSYDAHGKKMIGYSDLGMGPEDDVAKEALVFMVVGMAGRWKAPVAYYLIKDLSAETQAQLLLHVLQALYDIGIKVHCLTMDGHGTNTGMCKYLGASLDVAGDLRPFFILPGTDHRVFILMDPCHAIKLVRNLLEAYQVIKSPTGVICWTHISSLHEEQEQLGLHLANKLTSRHVNFQQEKMKVSS